MNLHPIQAVRVLLGYDAVTDKKRRKAPRSITQSEDSVLKPVERKKLVATAREERRNIVLLAWMIRQHLDYVSRFTFQARTDNDRVNHDIERLVAWWSRKENCDASRRHPLRRIIRLAEASRTVDGDVGLIKLRTGRLQAIESDRIATPTRGQIPERLRDKLKDIEHGIVLNDFLEAREYLINRRLEKIGSGNLEFQVAIRAQDFILHGYFDRFDQVRGISPLSASLNKLQDMYETIDYQTLKIKFHAMFGIAISREADEDAGDFIYTDDDDDAAPDANTQRYRFELDPGLKLELNPGDRIDTIESKTPSAEFNDYVNIMIQLSILSLDFPYTFFDSRKSSYSAQRQDILRYLESAKGKRADNQDLLDEITAWKINTWINTPDTESGDMMLSLPANMTVRDLHWEWIPTGVPWIDPLKEMNAFAKAITIGLKSRQQISAELGLDWFETLGQLEREETEIVRRGVTVQIADPGAVTTRDEETDNAANEESEM